MRALILTAGLGTRLRPLTCVRAKPAVPVNGEPLVRRVIRWLVAQGIDDLVLNLHHQPPSISGVVGDGADLGARVRYSWENPVLGSAGGPRHALPLLVDGSPPDEARFVIVNGDTLTDFQLSVLMKAHAASGALVTMAVVPNPEPERYGGVVVENGRVREFTRPGSPGEHHHFVGVQIVQARVFAHLPEGMPAESVTGLYRALIGQNAVAACAVEAAFQDIGTPADYLQTSLDLAAVEGDRLVSGARVHIDETAVVRRSIVWDDVRVGADCSIEDCILGDGAVIPAGARYTRCAIVPHRGEALQGAERLEGPLVVRRF